MGRVGACVLDSAKGNFTDIIHYTSKFSTKSVPLVCYPKVDIPPVSERPDVHQLLCKGTQFPSLHSQSVGEYTGQ